MADRQESSVEDARRAVIEAARKDGHSVRLGEYRARRGSINEPDIPADTYPVVGLYRLEDDGENVFLGAYSVVHFQKIKDDWQQEIPGSVPSADVLPADEFDVDEIFLDVSLLPGDPEDSDSDP